MQLRAPGSAAVASNWHGFRNVTGECRAMGMERPDDGDAG